MVQRIRRLAAVQTSREYGDGALLERFVGAADEAAFTVLVERHGAMVFGVCQRVLGNTHDAEDACQATFLVLARKASSLRKRSALGSWLHGIAFRISANLKRQLARRQKREQTALRLPSPLGGRGAGGEGAAPLRSTATDAGGDLSWREMRTVLDEELQRLPERYRTALVLCYLEGETRDEAAHRLGATPGALHGLLERGRNLLRERLIKRGLSLSAALLSTALVTTPAPAALPPALVVASAKAAALLASGRSLADVALAPHILTLVQEAMKTMLVTKVKIATALVLSAGLAVVFLTGSWGSVTFAQDSYRYVQVAQPGTPAPKPESDADFIRRVSKDLRGKEPTPAEIHFFSSSKETNKRQRLIDLFIQERQTAKKADEGTSGTRAQAAEALTKLAHAQQLLAVRVRLADEQKARETRVALIQSDYFKQVLAVTKDKKEVEAITQNFLDRLMQYVKAHPKNDDVPDAMLHISFVYRSQGKNVEADAWRAKLLKEYPSSPAAKTAQETRTSLGEVVPLLRTIENPLQQGRIIYELIEPKEKEKK